jgi:hypothetical protein
MEIAEFIDRFGPRITVWVDWARLQRLSLGVETRLISSHDELAALGLPWYVDAVGASGNPEIELFTVIGPDDPSLLLDLTVAD